MVYLLHIFIRKRYCERRAKAVLVKQGKGERPTLPDIKINSAVLAQEYKINQWNREPGNRPMRTWYMIEVASQTWVSQYIASEQLAFYL